MGADYYTLFLGGSIFIAVDLLRERTDVFGSSQSSLFCYFGLDSDVTRNVPAQSKKFKDKYI
jgi:hypothetical protein